MEVFTFHTHDTPVGPVTSVCSPRGLVRVVFGQLLDCAPVPAPHAPVEEQLQQYFAGERRAFDLPLDWSAATGFRGEAQRALIRIPYGETVTYAGLARLAGRPKAARAAGTACATNPLPIIVPCHRVVPAGGGLGRYSGPDGVKEALLRLEGHGESR